MQRNVLDAYPKAALAVLVVWVPALASDTLAEAKRTTGLITDARVQHFYDRSRKVGTAIATTVGGPADAVAYDTYLFYRAGPSWLTIPPLPAVWMHQLGPSTWADPSRFRWAQSLTSELRAAVVEVL